MYAPEARLPSLTTCETPCRTTGSRSAEPAAEGSYRLSRRQYRRPALRTPRERTRRFRPAARTRATTLLTLYRDGTELACTLPELVAQAVSWDFPVPVLDPRSGRQVH